MSPAREDEEAYALATQQTVFLEEFVNFDLEICHRIRNARCDGFPVQKISIKINILSKNNKTFWYLIVY